MSGKFRIWDRVHANWPAPPEYLGGEGAVIELRSLTPEVLVHFDHGLCTSACLPESCISRVGEVQSLPRDVTALTLAAAALICVPTAPAIHNCCTTKWSAPEEPLIDEVHTHIENSGDAGKLDSLDLNTPTITGGERIEFVKLAADLREPAQATVRRTSQRNNRTPMPEERRQQSRPFWALRMTPQNRRMNPGHRRT
jgi:hypothetical protein